jgi:hypothetical protein
MDGVWRFEFIISSIVKEQDIALLYKSRLKLVWPRFFDSWDP